MVSIEEELALAKQAKAAIEGKLTTEAIEVPRKAYRMAAMQPAFASALRDARHNVGLALPPVTGGQPNQEEIEEVKSAIDAWIEALEGSL
jgi:hypothetical protein